MDHPLTNNQSTNNQSPIPMCVNLKTFNESFRKWAEERAEEEEAALPYAGTLPGTPGKPLLLADLPREKLIAQQPEAQPKE
jgi:hypothetical protein